MPKKNFAKTKNFGFVVIIALASHFRFQLEVLNPCYPKLRLIKTNKIVVFCQKQQCLLRSCQCLFKIKTCRIHNQTQKLMQLRCKKFPFLGNSDNNF